MRDVSIVVCVCVWGGGNERGNTGVNMLLLQCDLLGGHESISLLLKTHPTEI